MLVERVQDERVQEYPAPTEKRARPAPAPVPVEYEAVTGIDYPEGADNLKRALAGRLSQVTKWVRLEPGDSANDVPECDKPWLLTNGFIKVVKP